MDRQTHNPHDPGHICTTSEVYLTFWGETAHSKRWKTPFHPFAPLAILFWIWLHRTILNQVQRQLIADTDRVRYIFGLKRHDHITEHRVNLQALNPENRAKLLSATPIHKPLTVVYRII